MKLTKTGWFSLCSLMLKSFSINLLVSSWFWLCFFWSCLVSQTELVMVCFIFSIQFLICGLISGDEYVLFSWLSIVNSVMLMKFQCEKDTKIISRDVEVKFLHVDHEWLTFHLLDQILFRLEFQSLATMHLSTISKNQIGIYIYIHFFMLIMPILS